MAEKEKKKRVRKALWLVLGGVLILEAAQVLTVAFLFFEPLEQQPPVAATPEDLVFHSRLAGRVMQQLWRGKPKQDELILDQARVESTLRLLDNAWEIGQLEGKWTGVMAPRYWEIHLLPEGRIGIVFPYDTKMRFCRGGIVVLRGRGTLEKGADNLWKIELEEAKLGRVSVPVSQLNGRIAQELVALREAGKLKKLDAAVLRFRVDGEGKAHVTYRPAGLLKILMR